jgi:hypothetical protein
MLGDAFGGGDEDRGEGWGGGDDGGWGGGDDD